MLTIIMIVLLVSFVTCFVVGGIGISKYRWNSDDGPFVGLMIGGGISAFVFAGVFIGWCVLLTNINTIPKYDQQIAIIEEANKELENQICSSVEMYLKHEEQVYENLNIDVAIGLFSAYPNLKSNELVQSLINTYKENTEEIKSLRISQSELITQKWLIYFGKE